jgi:TetR/AcrR family transcriptional regulator
LNQEAPVGRRERNKLEKLERITAVARELFAEKGISEVTTNEVALRAEIAAGTLFLYAKTKGELLLLAQNASYAEAHEVGMHASAKLLDPVAAILALLKPIIICNRDHVENGRTYLQEVVFGISNDGHRQEAIKLMTETERAVASIAAQRTDDRDALGDNRARAAMAILFLTLSSPLNVAKSVEDLVAELEIQLRLLFV